MCYFIGTSKFWQILNILYRMDGVLRCMYASRADVYGIELDWYGFGREQG
jgi:hypothetical protein